MKTIHRIQFPRFGDDVETERRTLFHVPLDDRGWAAGDGLLLIAEPSFPRNKLAVLTDVRQVRLRSELAADLDKLAAATVDEYLARWDALHPESPSSVDPEVWRIEFRYGPWDTDPTDPPEWSLAS